MSTKRTKKATKEAAAKKALEQRMLDLLLGAHGGYEMVDVYSDENGGLAAECGLDTFGRWIGAMQKALTFANDGQREFIASPRVLEKFDTFPGAVEWLYGLGVRA